MLLRRERYQQQQICLVLAANFQLDHDVTRFEPNVLPSSLDLICHLSETNVSKQGQ